MLTSNKLIIISVWDQSGTDCLNFHSSNSPYKINFTTTIEAVGNYQIRLYSASALVNTAGEIDFTLYNNKLM